MTNDGKRQLVVDLHSDIPLDIAIRRARGEREVFRRHHYERLKQSGTQVLIAALWAEPEFRGQSGLRLIQLLGSILADVSECADIVQWVTNQDETRKAVSEGKVALYLGVEGMTFVEDWPLAEADERVPGTRDAKSLDVEWRPKEQLTQSLALLQAHGLRQAILAWGEANAIASGPVPDTGGMQGRQGLTRFGGHVVHSLAERNVIIDISHLDDASADGVFAATPGCVIASHSNARSLCDVPRNLLDRHIRAIGERGGLVGINSYAGFLTEDGATLDDFVNHVVYVANLIGIDGVGFGFDFMDYLDYLDFPPNKPVTKDLEGVHDVPKLIQRMGERGFTDAEIDKIAYGNALRILSSGQ